MRMLSTTEIRNALNIVVRLNHELETQDYVEEQFHTVTDGTYLWINFVDDRIFDSQEEEVDFDMTKLEVHLRTYGQEAADFRRKSLANVKLR